MFIACAGIGFAHRGFETFSRECFEALRGRDDVRVTLVKGRGPRAPGDLTARAPGRDGAVARVLGRVLGREPYAIEQLGFSLAMLAPLAIRRPDVVFFSEWWVGLALARWRRTSRQRFKLLLSNGGLYPPERLGHVDHVHQLTPHELARALDAGVPAGRQTLLPLGVAIDRELRTLSPGDRAALRRRLRLPVDRPVAIAVAALNRQKRHDHIARELASLPEPRPFLLMLGQREPETPALEAEVTSVLGEDGFSIRTVEPREVARHYRAADAFVLASLWEAFGRVMIEAMSHGLPCLVHDGPTQRYVLEDEAFTVDMLRPGSLAARLPEVLAEAGDPAAPERRHRFVRERYSWARVGSRYAEMLKTCAAS